MIPGVSLTDSLKKAALEIGFDLAGVAPASSVRDLEFARHWLEQGYGGEMYYLENVRRHDLRRVLPSAQSVVCVGLIYNAPLPYSEEAKSRVTGGESPRAWISRYAWGRDYHELMRAKLEQLRAAIEKMAAGVETRVYVDTGPIVERAFARLSGIGWTGKNTCLINEQKGSWFFLGVVLTNLVLAPDVPAPDRCGSCTACLEACPTGALVEPYVMDASRCIAYLNIELKGSIPLEFRPAIGANVFGCDICQDVCPWNSKGRNQESGARSQNGPGQRAAATTSLPDFQPLEIPLTPAPNPQPLAFSLFNPRLEDLAAMSEEDFRQAFRHSPIKRAKYRGWLRNLCVAMGNSGDRRFIPKLEELAQYPDEIVREHATWALGRCDPAARPKS
jgi:epoxyqueuosine reductase